MNKDDAIKDNLLTLNLINYQIAELSRIKEELESRVCALVEHSDEGSKTYTYDKFKVTVTTGYNYSLNKEEYEQMNSHIKDCFNPVRKRSAYDLDKQIIRDIKKYGSEEDLKLFESYISVKPKKIHVSIKAGV